MELEEEHLQDQITGAIDRNQPNKSAKTWNPQGSKNNNGVNLRIAIPAHLSESCGTSGGDHAPNGEREKRESEWSDREIRRRGSKKLETVWGPPCVQPQTRQTTTEQIPRTETSQRKYRTLQKSSAGSRRITRVFFIAFPFYKYIWAKGNSQKCARLVRLISYGETTGAC